MSPEDYIVEMFVNFLKEKKAYDKFLANYESSSVVSINQYYHNMLFGEPGKGAVGLISCAFSWDHSKEGSVYWRGINDGWKGLIK